MSWGWVHRFHFADFSAFPPLLWALGLKDGRELGPRAHIQSVAVKQNAELLQPLHREGGPITEGCVLEPRTPSSHLSHLHLNGCETLWRVNCAYRGCWNWLFQFPRPFYGLQSVSPRWPRTADINKTFSSTLLRLSGYFLSFTTILCNPLRWLHQQSSGSRLRSHSLTAVTHLLISRSLWSSACLCTRLNALCHCIFAVSRHWLMCSLGFKVGLDVLLTVTTISHSMPLGVRCRWERP